MEFLTEFGQPLKTINESDYSFYDIESLKEYLFGCPVISNGIIKKIERAGGIIPARFTF